jgi:hypothetical protein
MEEWGMGNGEWRSAEWRSPAFGVTESHATLQVCNAGGEAGAGNCVELLRRRDFRTRPHAAGIRV